MLLSLFLLLLPVEWCKLCIGTLPTRFAQSVDYKRHDDHNYTAHNKDCYPSSRIARRDLCRRDKAKDKRQQRATEAQACDNPHCKVTTKTEWAVGISHTIAQNNCRRKEHHIHYKVQRSGHLRENLIERLHRRHNHKEQRKERYYCTLDKQDITLDAIFVTLLKKRRQITRLTYGKDTL